MKKYVLIILVTFVSFLSFGFFIHKTNYNSSNTNSSNTSHNFLNSVFTNNQLVNSSYLQNSNLSSEEYGKIWNTVQKLSNEQSVSESSSEWKCIGPFGMNYQGSSTIFSGRILDIEVNSGASTRIGSASGGLWEFGPGGTTIPLSDNLNTLVIGSFDSKPGDPNVIFVGTGEPIKRSGTGLWKTIDRGQTWTNIKMAGENPTSFFKLRYDPVSSNIIHSATLNGYYRSDNGGTNWTKKLTDTISDIAINPIHPDTMYAAKWGHGVYKSIDRGNNWQKIVASGIPSSKDSVGRTAIAISSSNPSIIYVSMTKKGTSQTLGVYKSTDAGLTWKTVTPNPDFHGYQGYYNNAISVSPINSNIVLVGGISLWRSTNGGSSWTEVSNENVHADHHVMTWSSINTSYIWLGNDGGMSFSQDAGSNWSTASNTFPITQYVSIGVGKNNTNVIFGGSQDNGLIGTTDGGLTWNQTLPYDGGGISINPNDASQIYATAGMYGSWFFKRCKSTNTGQNWSFIDNGLSSTYQMYTDIRNDQVEPIYLYNNYGSHVICSEDKGSNWTKVNPDPFPFEVSNLTISKYTSGGAVIYACLRSTLPSSNRLRIYDNGVWYERSSGLPTSALVKTVSPHISNSNIAYALMNGTGTPGQKIYKTTNRGKNWYNISGDLPDIPLDDLVSHPTYSNILYLGTEMGFYKTTNSGTNWYKWSEGMPQANIITELTYIDSLSSKGTFYILAASYGRSVWLRGDGNNSDNFLILENNVNIPNKFELNQNYPNPFNPSTTIKFSLPIDDFVELKVYDVSGREVKNLITESMNAGFHEIKFESGDLTSGIYFYRMKTGKFSDTKKMMIIK